MSKESREALARYTAAMDEMAAAEADLAEAFGPEGATILREALSDAYGAGVESPDGAPRPKRSAQSGRPSRARKGCGSKRVIEFAYKSPAYRAAAFRLNLGTQHGKRVWLTEDEIPKVRVENSRYATERRQAAD